jgi:hypothetical protein
LELEIFLLLGIWSLEFCYTPLVPSPQIFPGQDLDCPGFAGLFTNAATNTVLIINFGFAIDHNETGLRADDFALIASGAFFLIDFDSHYLYLKNITNTTNVQYYQYFNTQPHQFE